MNSEINSFHFKILNPLIKKLKVKKLFRAKANLNPISHKINLVLFKGPP